MARLIIVEHQPRRLVDVVAIVIALLLLAATFIASNTPTYLKVLVAVASLLVIGGALQSLIYGPRLARVLKALSKDVRVEGERLILPKPLKMKPGTITISYHRAETGYDYYTRLSFKESEEGEVVKDSLGPKDFKGNVGILAGLPWEVTLDTGSSTEPQASRKGGKPPILVWDAYEWIVAPAYEIVDPDYSGPSGSIIVAFIPRINYEIEVTKSVLTVKGDGATGTAEMGVESGAIKGTITYTKQPGSRAREVRLEFEAVKWGIRYRITLAKLSNPGRINFRWSPGPEEEAYLLIHSQARTRPRELLRRLSTNPLLAGAAWRDIKWARLKLVLNVPLARDVVDVAWVTVKPAWRP